MSADANRPAVPPEFAGPIAAAMSRRGEAIAIGNRAGVIEWTNDAWTRVTGWALDEALDKPVARLLEQAGVETSILDFVQGHFLAGRRCALELELDGADGRPRCIHLEVEPIDDGSGEVGRFIAVAADVTRRAPQESSRRPSDVAGSARPEMALAPEDPAARRLEAFAAEALGAARRVEQLCGEIERTAAVGLLDELGVRSVWRRARESADCARKLLDHARDGAPDARPLDLAALLRDALRVTAPPAGSRVQLDVVVDAALPPVLAPAALLAEVVEDLLRAGIEAIDGEWGIVSVTAGLTEPDRPLISPVYHVACARPLGDVQPRAFVEVHDTGAVRHGRAARSAALLPDRGGRREASLREARARLAECGIELDVHATPGAGTRALLLVPLAPACGRPGARRVRRVR